MTLQKWILFAEDNTGDADLGTRILSNDSFHCDVLWARDGEEVLDCLHRRGEFAARPDGHPALVLLDRKMPRMDGLEVLRQLKADAQWRTIPVVVFNSSREAADLARSYQLGANAYVVKPVDFRQFGEVLKAIKSFWMVANEPPPPNAGALNSSVPERARHAKQVHAMIPGAMLPQKLCEAACADEA